MNKDTYIRVFDIRVAKKLGVNGAIIIQQIEYWIDITRKQSKEDPNIKKKHFHNGKWWIYNTFDQWQEQLPFFSMSTLKREFSKLEKTNYLLVDRFNIKAYDRTKWYTINNDALENLIECESVKMTQCIVSKWNDAKCQNDTMQSVKMKRPIPKNTTKNTTENTNQEYRKGKSPPAISPGSQESKKDISINYHMLEKQISILCNLLEITNSEIITQSIIYFYKRYKLKRGSEHPKFKSDNYKTIITVLSEFDVSVGTLTGEEWEKIIDKYFETSFENCDYRLNHFASKKILDNRFLEEIY